MRIRFGEPRSGEGAALALPGPCQLTKATALGTAAGTGQEVGQPLIPFPARPAPRREGEAPPGLARRFSATHFSWFLTSSTCAPTCAPTCPPTCPSTTRLLSWPPLAPKTPDIPPFHSFLKSLLIFLFF